MNVNIMLDEDAKMPTRAHETDAGYDLYSPVDCIIYGGDSVVIDTGVHIEIPAGYVGFLKSKSGLNVNHGLTGEGVIDAGYTGSIKVKLYNHNADRLQLHQICDGDKIIQLVLLPIITPELTLVKRFADTPRGGDGFGSTGR